MAQAVPDPLPAVEFAALQAMQPAAPSQAKQVMPAPSPPTPHEDKMHVGGEGSCPYVERHKGIQIRSGKQGG